MISDPGSRSRSQLFHFIAEHILKSLSSTSDMPLENKYIGRQINLLNYHSSSILSHLMISTIDFSVFSSKSTVLYIFQINQMKTNFQKGKLALNRYQLKRYRKISGSASSIKEKEEAAEEKTDKLLQLRAKIEKERQIMKMSGKRFSKNSQTSSTSKEIYKLQRGSQLEKTEGRFVKKEIRVADVSVGDEPTQNIEEVRPATRQTVDLTSLVTETEEVSLSSSRLFDKQLVKQKDRNKEVFTFLKKIGLEDFAEGLINLGYDELDVLVDVSNEELNFLMMRAAQQRALIAALKEYREKTGLQQTKQVQQFLSTSTAFKVKAKNQVIKEKKVDSIVTSFRPKSAMTVASTTPTNNSGLFSSSVKPNPSFFIGIGGQEWSMDSLVRRACSGCFKIVPGVQLVEEDGIFYCRPCKQKQDDPLGISLNSSMVRDYKL